MSTASGKFVRTFPASVCWGTIIFQIRERHTWFRWNTCEANVSIRHLRKGWSLLWLICDHLTLYISLIRTGPPSPNLLDFQLPCGSDEALFSWFEMKRESRLHLSRYQRAHWRNLSHKPLSNYHPTLSLVELGEAINILQLVSETTLKFWFLNSVCFWHLLYQSLGLSFCFFILFLMNRLEKGNSTK